MHGDFSRDTFDKTRHFSRVLMQQGRVQLDADWNEQTSILLHHLRTLLVDLIGPHGGPEAAMGFGVLTAPGADVDALFAGNAARLQAVNSALAQGGDILFAPGRYYVGGLMVEVERPMLFSEQPGMRDRADDRLGEIGGARAAGVALYLDAWERHVTFAEVGGLRECALGGADTCSRAQVAWRIGAILDVSQADAGKEVGELAGVGSGRMQARARVNKPVTELCVVPADAHYRGVENQLYRVEIHRAGAAVPNGATWKWSRENGAVTYPVRSIAGRKIHVEHLGRDVHGGVEPREWVELVDDAAEFDNTSGILARVVDVDLDELTLTVESIGDLPSLDEAMARACHATLRRWDHAGAVDLEGALQLQEYAGVDPDAGWLSLEDGIAVRFAAGGNYRTGDYWLVPARVATGDVEWPTQLDVLGKVVRDAAGNAVPASMAPNGPVHHYAPLAWWGAAAPVDLRKRFKPLSI